jgi:hypothetical protein
MRSSCIKAIHVLLILPSAVKLSSDVLFKVDGKIRKFGGRLPFRGKIPPLKLSKLVHQQTNLVQDQQQIGWKVNPLIM